MTDRDPLLEKPLLPQEPIHRLIRPLSSFLHVEASSGFVLLVCSLVALALANSPLSAAFIGFWEISAGLTFGSYEVEHSLKHWINDGLMSIFFFVIGLEIKREIALGELQNVRRAALPLAAALGGMAVPAGIYLALQFGQPGQDGWGVPMATDIAFVVGCLAVIGRRIPGALRVILLSLAIVDDLGAILVIAVGYTETLHLTWLAMGLAGIGGVMVMQRLGIRSMGLYTLTGVLIWVGFHESGIHATIAGVAIGLLTPAHPYLDRGVGNELLRHVSELIHGGIWEHEDQRAEKIRQYRQVSREMISPLEYLIYLLHPWVAFVIMPLFALANAGVPFGAADVVSPVAVAVILGLAVGKPVGILLLCWLSVKSGLAQLPQSVSWRHMVGGGFLAGIGFTMALFIAGLAFADEGLLRPAKVGVLLGSVVSGMIGMLILGTAPVPPPIPPKP